MNPQNSPVYTQYAPAIMAAILDLFRPDEEKEAHLFHFELGEIDATDFFTAIPIALTAVMNELTGEENDALGTTHLLNRLIAQHNVQRVQLVQLTEITPDED